MDLELDSIYEGLVEYYINDYTIFEATLKRDFLEVTGVLTEETNRNFIQQIWDKIIAIVYRAAQQISVLVDSILIKYDEGKIKKYSKKLEEVSKLANEAKFRNFKEFKYDKYYSVDGSALNEIKKEVENFLTIDQVFSENNENVRNKIKKSKEYFSSIHTKIWKTKYSGSWENKINAVDISKNIIAYAEEINKNRNLKSKILKHYDTLRKEAKKKKDEAKKSSSEADVKIAKTALDTISLLSRMDFMKIKFIIKEQRAIFKNELNLSEAVVEYMKKYIDSEDYFSDKAEEQVSAAFKEVDETLKDLHDAIERDTEELKKMKEKVKQMRRNQNKDFGKEDDDKEV